MKVFGMIYLNYRFKKYILLWDFLRNLFRVTVIQIVIGEISFDYYFLLTIVMIIFYLSALNKIKPFKKTHENQLEE
jgi:hypothetical protein